MRSGGAAVRWCGGAVVRQREEADTLVATMVRWLAISIVVFAQLVGVPLGALAACGTMAAACAGKDAAAASFCMWNGECACPCCGGDEQAPAAPEKPALPPAAKTMLDVAVADAPSVGVWLARPTARVVMPAGDGRLCCANARRVQAVLCRWRT